MLKKIINKIGEGYLREMMEETAWIYRYARRYWLSIGFYIVAGVFGTLMGLGSSVLSKYLIDAVTGTNHSNIPLLAVLMVMTALFSILANAVISRISARISVVVQNEMQAEIYNKVIDTDWESLHEFRSGDLLNRLSVDASTVSSSVIGWVPSLISKLVAFIGALVIILYYDPVMAVFALLSSPVTIIISRMLMRRMRTYNKEMRQISSDLMSFQNDSFQNLQTLKAFDLMSVFKDKLVDIQGIYKDKMLDYNRFSVYTSSFMSIVGMIVSYVCLGWSVYRLWTGYITPGTLIMFLQMSSQLTSAFSALVALVPSAISATTSAGRLMDICELEKEQFRDEENIEKIYKKKKDGLEVSLDHIDVIYKEGNQVVADGCFKAKSGEITALIGPSGEGKTTLVRVLLGLIYPADGQAVIVSKDGFTCEISTATRRLFGYVPQGNTIFAGTIAENMRLVRSDATDEDIIEALELACAWEFVKELPDQINTVIGEHGTGVSEGQAQRLAIARAILRDAPILLLDEATSALDMAIEERVLNNIMKYGKNKTCIVTTHRPSVLDMSSHIYEIRENSLIQVK